MEAQSEHTFDSLPESWLDENQRFEVWKKVVFHIDMDAFFASIEQRNRPELLGKPVIVGGPEDARGVVSACSYETRPFGVRSGMPLGQAKKLCPQAIFIEGRLKQYGFVSAELMKILSDFTPFVEPFSVDEAFMDVTGSMRMYKDPVTLARSVKSTILEKLKLTCSIGIAPNKIISKMSSKLQKPDGLTMIDQALYRDYYADKPAGKLWGIGEKTAEALKRVGIKTVHDLCTAEPKLLERTFGKNGGWMQSVAQGEDDSPVYALEGLPDEKSISHETTFAKDSLDRQYVFRALLAMSEKVARRLRRSGFLARTVSVKVRSAAFQTITRDYTLSHPTADHRVIHKIAKELIPPDYAVSVPVRLVGVKGSNLIKPSQKIQIDIFDTVESSKATDKLGKVIDSVKDRWGDASLTSASLVRNRKQTAEDPNSI